MRKNQSGSWWEIDGNSELTDIFELNKAFGYSGSWQSWEFENNILLKPVLNRYVTTCNIYIVEQKFC